jgi:DNA-binding NtrC family response regulator
MSKTRIALIQRSPTVAWLKEEVRANFDVQRFSDVSLYAASKSRIGFGVVVVSDLGGSTQASIESIEKIKQGSPTVPIVLIVTGSCEESAIAALKAGAQNYLKAPVTPGQLMDAIRPLVAAEETRTTCQSRLMRRWIVESEASLNLFAYASKLALTRSTVLITGETGTGKDLAAELIHSMGPRRHKPFVALNCAAIPDSLLESELFGREKGAYTGADTAYDGKLKLAEGGTVFFDEIGDLTPYGQAKLLRVLENRQVQRLGSSTDIPLDIRVLAATNQDLRGMVERGLFRRDLYYRLSVTHLGIPPLRDRREDIPPLLDHFASSFSRDMPVPFPGFSTSALRALVAYNWPGNVRELRNVVEELAVRVADHPLQVEDLPFEVTGQHLAQPIAAPDEKSKILQALETTQWNKKRAAERLCWSRMTLYRKMTFYRISDVNKGKAEEPLLA